MAQVQNNGNKFNVVHIMFIELIPVFNEYMCS
jgi:hypothetical protein